MINGQMTLGEINPEYQAFVDKFKPKKTTDDCYTPPNIYEVVLNWCVKEYGIDPENVVRPFWPGGDYERFEYPQGCTVIDNPPFSMITAICNTYNRAGIKYFLFCPYLTALNIHNASLVVTGSSIRYENGAEVGTSFATNLETCKARTAPDLSKAIKQADDFNRKQQTKEMPKYSYPANILTASMLGYMSKYGIDYRVNAESTLFVRALDSQVQAGKTIFGGGLLLAERAAKEKDGGMRAATQKAAEEKTDETQTTVWPLSDRERRIIKRLGDGQPAN